MSGLVVIGPERMLFGSQPWGQPMFWKSTRTSIGSVGQALPASVLAIGPASSAPASGSPASGSVITGIGQARHTFEPVRAGASAGASVAASTSPPSLVDTLPVDPPVPVTP